MTRQCTYSRCSQALYLNHMQNSSRHRSTGMTLFRWNRTCPKNMYKKSVPTPPTRLVRLTSHQPLRINHIPRPIRPRPTSHPSPYNKAPPTTLAHTPTPCADTDSQQVGAPEMSDRSPRLFTAVCNRIRAAEMGIRAAGMTGALPPRRPARKRATIKPAQKGASLRPPPSNILMTRCSCVVCNDGRPAERKMT